MADGISLSANRRKPATSFFTVRHPVDLPLSDMPLLGEWCPENKHLIIQFANLLEIFSQFDRSYRAIIFIQTKAWTSLFHLLAMAFWIIYTKDGMPKTKPDTSRHLRWFNISTAFGVILISLLHFQALFQGRSSYFHVIFLLIPPFLLLVLFLNLLFTRTQQAEKKSDNSITTKMKVIISLIFFLTLLYLYKKYIYFLFGPVF